MEGRPGKTGAASSGHTWSSPAPETTLAEPKTSRLFQPSRIYRLAFSSRPEGGGGTGGCRQEETEE